MALTPPHSRLTLGPRPKVKAAAGLAQRGLVACALLPQEQPAPLLRAYGKNGVHLPFTVYGLRDLPPIIRPRVVRLSDRLLDGTPVHVHCAAGKHRTGVVGYALLRLSGYTRSSALDAIEEIRPITHFALTSEFPALVNYAERVLLDTGRRTS